MTWLNNVTLTATLTLKIPVLAAAKCLLNSALVRLIAPFYLWEECFKLSFFLSNNFSNQTHSGKMVNFTVRGVRGHGLRTTTGSWNVTMKQSLCFLRGGLFCNVWPMCCSGTTLQRVPCCDWSSCRRDARCGLPHSAAARVHNPKPQQQSSWVPHTMTWMIKPLSQLCSINVMFLLPGLHDMLFGL